MRYRKNSVRRKNPRSESERRQYEREVAAWQASKELERDIWWSQQREIDQERRGERLNPSYLDTCPSYMDYNWWLERFAPPHVQEAERKRKLAEQARRYPIVLTPEEQAQSDWDEAHYGRAMRREARQEAEKEARRFQQETGQRTKRTKRKNPLPVAAIASAVLPYIIKALGSRVSAFNALPLNDRKARVRAFLTGKQRWSLGIGAGMAGPQVAKSDAAVSAIVHAVEQHGSRAVEAGGATVTARLMRANPPYLKDMGKPSADTEDLLYAIMAMDAGEATKKDLRILSHWSKEDLTKPGVDHSAWVSVLLKRLKHQYPAHMRYLGFP